MNGIIEVEMGMTGILKANMKESALLTMQLPAGRIAQFSVCFRNALTQFFVHRSWMVLPMTAVLSLIAGFAIRDGFLTTMEETMTGAFLLTGLCIWNGSYSSIQASCREREVIRLRYGLGKEAPITQREVAQRLGISRSYVSRIEKNVLERMNAYLTHGRDRI